MSEDTLPQWLYERFHPRSQKFQWAGIVAWNDLETQDKTYWADEADAVRRAVTANGYHPRAGARYPQPEILTTIFLTSLLGRRATELYDMEAVVELLVGSQRTGTRDKISAIKLARSITQWSLRDTKDAVDVLDQWLKAGYDPRVPITDEDEQAAIESIKKAAQ